jgi:acyl-CoA synthetase (NDP forming)
MKSGTSKAGARAAGSHTAALAGSERAVEALFHQAGVLRAETLEELIDAAALLSTQPLPRGRHVVLLTNAGGLGILCSDACEAAGLELSELTDDTRSQLAALLPEEASLANPVDMLGSATAASYEAVVPILLADPTVDALIVLFVPPATAGAGDVAEGLARTLDAVSTDKPVLAALLSDEGIPAALRKTPAPAALFTYPESAARALGLAAQRAEWLRRPAGTVPVVDGINARAAEEVVARALDSAEDVWLSPAETRELLGNYGVPLVAERLESTADSAVAAAAEVGYPVVVKSGVPGAHKTETGGVALDLPDEAAVREAVERIGTPVIVQPMIKGGTELLAGIVQDPTFGPLVAFGPGGVLAELIGEAGFRIAPLTDADAEELLHQEKTGLLVAGYRGNAPADPAALTDLIHRLSRLGVDLPQVAELDLNPVIAGPDGCVVVDARVRVHHPDASALIKTW